MCAKKSEQCYGYSVKFCCEEDGMEISFFVMKKSMNWGQKVLSLATQQCERLLFFSFIFPFIRLLLISFSSFWSNCHSLNTTTDANWVSPWKSNHWKAVLKVSRHQTIRNNNHKHTRTHSQSNRLMGVRCDCHIVMNRDEGDPFNFVCANVKSSILRGWGKIDFCKRYTQQCIYGMFFPDFAKDKGKTHTHINPARNFH